MIESSQVVVGTQVEYLYATPYGCEPIVGTGSIEAVKEYCGETYVRVVPDDPSRFTKDRPASHITRVITQKEKIVA